MNSPHRPQRSAKRLNNIWRQEKIWAMLSKDSLTDYQLDFFNGGANFPL